MNDAPPGGGGSLRASDAERDAAAAELRRHLEDGRLTMEEFSERLDEVYAARTRAQLTHARRELPDLAPETPRRIPVPPSAPRHANGLRRLVRLAWPSLVCVGVWATSGHHGAFWPGWVMLGTGAVALRRLGKGPGTRAQRRAARVASLDGEQTSPTDRLPHR